MISCTEFIPAYSELFKYIEQIDGEEAVMKYWESLGDTGLKNLEELASEHGLRGCFMYWTKSLNEEAADFTMTLNEEETEFMIDMHHCPSKGMLMSLDHMEPYHNYCGHCTVLYPKVLEPMGYKYIADLTECDKAKCKVFVKK